MRIRSITAEKMSSTSVESAASLSSELKITFEAIATCHMPEASMQSKRVLGDNSGQCRAKKKSKGKWRCVSCCPVLLEMAHCHQSKKDKILIVPQQSEPLGELSSQPSSSPQPVRTELVVDNDRLSVYGALRAKKDSNEIDIVIERPDSTASKADLSCKLVLVLNPDNKVWVRD